MKHARVSKAQAGLAPAPTSTSGDAGKPLDVKLQAAAVLHRQGQLDQAEVLYKEILLAQPQHFDALQLLGTIAAQRNHAAEAVVLFDLALKIHPANAGVLSNRGSALLNLSRPQEALDSCDRALRIMPNYAEALSNRGNALWALKRPEEALVSFDHALKIKPDYAEALSNRGAALRALNRHIEALDSYDRALRIRPDFAQALNNRGAALQDLNRQTEALANFCRAQEVQPDHAEAHVNEALCRLMLGEFSLGWQKYEWRWKKEPGLSAARNFVQPLWLGKEPLEGKTLLLHAEQGLGDTLQFCRYVQQVAALGAQVVLEVQPALKTLLQGLEGASLVLGRGEPLPDFDYHCPLLSLPLAFQADLSNISGAAYLHSEPKKRAQWQERLGASNHPRIGLVWSGSRGHQNDHNRSLALQDMRSLLSEQDSYYCLQKELRPEDQVTLNNTPGIEFLGDSLQDFSDTAAVVDLMDLVITVDTSVAHLAGAMGKEVWLLLAYSPDWRWLLERSDSPWYNSARLFRQPAPGDWASVLGQVQAALKVRLAAPQSEPEPEPGPAPVAAQKPPAMTAQALVDRLKQAVNLHKQGQLDQAQLRYKEILQVQPKHFDALQLLATIEAQKNNAAAAAVLFEQALRINPGHVGALNNHGNVLRALDRPEEALASYDQVLKVTPQDANALNHRGNALRALKRHGEALESYDRALKIKSDFVGALSNRGNVLRDLNRDTEAMESYDLALEIKPDFVDALISRGKALCELKRHAEAIESYKRALQVQPDNPEVHVNEALCRLQLGQFESGWSNYEWRWRGEVLRQSVRNFSQPLWLGKEPLAGKTLLLHAEQGLGDTLQFCRYVQQVAALGAQVVLEVQPALKTLLQGLEGASLVLGRGERLPDFDYHCPLLSLPLAFQADLSNISGAAYLQSEPKKRAQWQERLGPPGKTRMGLVWSGSTGHQNDHNRSLALQDMRSLLSEQASYYCLQKELRPTDREALASTPGIHFLGDSLQDFSDTAALVELMDLVITVDTSVAHLAGAMGKEVWLLLAYSPDWRWLLERSDSPWYNSARLFRQPAPGDWASVLGQVQAALKLRLVVGKDKDKAAADPRGVAGKLTSALALHQKGDLDSAEVLYKEILTAQPQHFEALQMLATIAAHRKDNADAVVLFEQALKVRPDHVGVHNDLGNALQAQGKTEEALQSYGRALDVQPDFLDALVNRGNVWRILQRVEEALKSYDRALQVSPNHAEVLNNRGVALLELGRPLEALASYQKAWRARPDYAEAHWNEALCQLLLGDFPQGWSNYEWRWKRKLNKDVLRNFSQPLWLGKEPLAGKTLLLHAEQGLGDTLQFCRYVQQVAALGAQVVLEVQPALKTLLQGLEGASLVLGRGERLPDFDYHCPLLSLPLAFQADLSNISGAAYLQSEPKKRAQWQERLGPPGKTRVGLVWSGSTGHQNDHNRSLSLQQLVPLISDEAQYYCLQKELRPEDQVTLKNTPGVEFLEDSLQDFSDTAALVELMDLVITVDTSVAHLAGAMGKEVWLLLAYSPDWRWLLERSDSPWYDSARLFRQPAPGDWASVLGQVQAALKVRLEAPQSEPESVPAPMPAAMTAQALADRLAQAVGLHQQGRLDQAEGLYKDILQVQPRHFDALQLLAMTKAQKNNPAAARVLFEQALTINPQHAGALSNYGNVLRALKCHEEALASYDRALQVQPDYAEALMNRGNTLWELQRPEEALASYDLALGIDPGNVEALASRGSVLGSMKRTLQALESFDRVLQIRPDDAQALINRGNALLDLKRAEESLESCEHALRIKPDFAEALSHRGNALRALNRNAEALESYDYALRLKPDYAEALSNRGATLQDLKRHAEALQSCTRAMQLEPGNAEAHWNEALCRLMLGEFLLGWQRYEWRWKKEPGLSAARNFSQRLWLGKEPLEGKTLLLHAEQGLGDTLQFCRYVQQVAALGARVVLEVQPALKTLLQGLEGASLVLGRGERLPDFDYHCPLLSLPLAFQADLSNISGAAYLQSEPKKRAQWQERLGASKQPRIGLVWSGSTGHQNDHNRSLSLQQLVPLISDEAQYYCLQKELRPEDQVKLNNTPGIEFLGDSLQDFSDTAAVVDLMDLVITVDTSVAHLAGAMGKEVWLLLAYSPDWRWLLERSDSPWYNSARLFRQPAPGDWTSVLGQVQAALKLRLSGVQRQPESAPAPMPAAMTAQALADRLAQAVGLHQQGRLDQAEGLYKEILQVQPQHFDALQLLAAIALQRKDPVTAMALFEQALRISPDHPSTLNNRGNALRDLSRPEEALASYDHALRLQPDYAEALTNRGAALRDLQRYAEALESYDRALRIKPDYALALSNRGNALRALKRPVEALASYDRALGIRPDDAQVLSNRGNALQDLKRPEEALQSFERALQTKPDFAEALSNRGKALWDLLRPAEALGSYERALQIKPDFVGAWSNRGGVLRDLMRHAAALECFGRALQLDPDDAEAHWNEALCRLMLGEFNAGWQKYEWRWKKEPGLSAARNFSQRLWLGKEPLEGKTLLLHAEQGLGDTLQFCRYVQQVAALGARVVLEVQPALKTLLQGLEGVSLVLGRGERLPDFDYHCPLLSLPLAFQADLSNISGAAYLHSDPDKRQAWQARLGPPGKTRVGLVWSGSTGHQNDHNRSLALQDMRSLLSEQASYYCLQKELRPEDQVTLNNTPSIEFLGDSLQDFSDTAAVVDLMDLVITVDTSVAHLAGGMGKEVWLLLAYSPDWRWLLERSDSPWYNSARLFRQPAPGDWASVLTQVKAALLARLR